MPYRALLASLLSGATRSRLKGSEARPQVRDEVPVTLQGLLDLACCHLAVMNGNCQSGPSLVTR